MSVPLLYSHDDVRLRVDRLRIVAPDVAVLGLEDAALGIGEVALRLRCITTMRENTSKRSVVSAANAL
jgi:hypothetical protein